MDENIATPRVDHDAEDLMQNTENTAASGHSQNTSSDSADSLESGDRDTIETMDYEDGLDTHEQFTSVDDVNMQEKSDNLRLLNVKVEAPDDDEGEDLDDNDFEFDVGAFLEGEDRPRSDVRVKLEPGVNDSEDCQDFELPEEDATCESCERSFKSFESLKKHIAHIKECKTFYGPRFDEMKMKDTKDKRHEDYVKRAAKERLVRREAYYKNREKTLQQSKEYYYKNREKLSSKKRDSYQKELIIKKLIESQDSEASNLVEDLKELEELNYEPGTAANGGKDAGKGEDDAVREAIAHLTQDSPEDTICECCTRDFETNEGLLKHIPKIEKCRDHYGDRFIAMKIMKKKGNKAGKRKYITSVTDDKRAKINEVRRMKRNTRYYKYKDQLGHKNRERCADKYGRERKVRESIYGGDFGERTEKFRSKKRLVIDEPKNGPQGKLDLNKSADQRLCVPLTDDSPPSSKIDFDNTPESEIFVLPSGMSLSGTHMYTGLVDRADGFVAMTLSSNEQNVEIKHLVRKEKITLRRLQILFHYVLAVCQSDLRALVDDRGSPIVITNFNSRIKFRNEFTKELVAAGVPYPEPPKPICLPVKSRETNFLDDQMKRIPFFQLLLNHKLAPIDTASVGVICGNEIYPMFSVNMDDWHFNIRLFFCILVNWMGTKEIVSKAVMMTPCGQMAKEHHMHDIKVDCYDVATGPKSELVCEHCGERFAVNPYLKSDRWNYRHHLNKHNVTCKICGEEFPNMKARVYHMHTHRDEYYKCDHCKYVAATKHALDGHVKMFHTKSICDHCGKEFASGNGLKHHLGTHHNIEPKDYHQLVCDLCGRTGFPSNSEYKKHMKRHAKPASKLNYTPIPRKDDGIPDAERRRVNVEIDSNGKVKAIGPVDSTVLYVCHFHDNCRKEYRELRYLRDHLKKTGLVKPDPPRPPRNIDKNEPDGSQYLVDGLYVCNVHENCNRKYKYMKYLREHWRRTGFKEVYPDGKAVGRGLRTIQRPPTQGNEVLIDEESQDVKPIFQNHFYVPGHQQHQDMSP